MSGLTLLAAMTAVFAAIGQTPSSVSTGVPSGSPGATVDSLQGGIQQALTSRRVHISPQESGPGWYEPGLDSYQADGCIGVFVDDQGRQTVVDWRQVQRVESFRNPIAEGGAFDVIHGPARLDDGSRRATTTLFDADRNSDFPLFARQLIDLC